ncbi:MAG: hypothetical protein ACRCXB_22915 [Aeromonadaceae bacterium]
MTSQVIAGVAVAPGEVKCGVYYGPARSGLSVPIGRAFHGDLEPVPLTEEAATLQGMDRYLSPDWDFPTCPVIGRGVNDHCQHGFGNLDYCPLCEHENDNIDLSDMEI